MLIAFILDSDFQHLAQMSQAHTLVGLARSANANPKFFLPPRKINWTKDVQVLIILIILLYMHFNQIHFHLGDFKKNS
jgi:hypothetical protein